MIITAVITENNQVYINTSSTVHLVVSCREVRLSTQLDDAVLLSCRCRVVACHVTVARPPTTTNHRPFPSLPFPTWSYVYTRRCVINHQPTYIQDPTHSFSTFLTLYRIIRRRRIRSWPCDCDSPPIGLHAHV